MRIEFALLLLSFAVVNASPICIAKNETTSQPTAKLQGGRLNSNAKATLNRNGDPSINKSASKKYACMKEEKKAETVVKTQPGVMQKIFAEDTKKGSNAVKIAPEKNEVKRTNVVGSGIMQKIFGDNDKQTVTKPPKNLVKVKPSESVIPTHTCCCENEVKATVTPKPEVKVNNNNASGGGIMKKIFGW